jgi:hypothetical protein
MNKITRVNKMTRKNRDLRPPVVIPDSQGIGVSTIIDSGVVNTTNFNLLASKEIREPLDKAHYGSKGRKPLAAFFKGKILSMRR